MIRRHSTRLSQAHEQEPDEGQDQRTAALDYPELGTVLTDRPDPGRQITVIGMRRQGEAYAQGHDERDEDYNGGEGDTGTYWAEPGEQGWVHEHAGPQQEAPPPLYDPDMMPPAMARLAAIEEAREFFGLRHHATTINGTQVDDAGDAPQHGTVPRAGEPNSYDDASDEGGGDDKWNQALPWGSKKDENAATVGMYPEGISSGGGPGISVGPFTAHLDYQRFTGRPPEDIVDHLRHGHTYRDEDLRNAAGDAHGDLYDPAHEAALHHSHAADHASWQGYYEHPHPSLGDFTDARPSDPEARTDHNRWLAGHLGQHMHDHHGIPGLMQSDPDDLTGLRSDHAIAHWNELHPQDGAGRSGEAEYGELQAPDEAEGSDWDTAAHYTGRPHGEAIDPVFGSHARTARVPWTGKERGTLHRWQAAPTATWGDFVPSDEFPLLGPGEHVSHEDDGEGIGPVEGSSDAEWERHLRYGHGWDDSRIGQARAQGGFRRVHEAVHTLGLAGHRHAGGPEDAREESRAESEDNMFGPAFPRRTPQQMPLARPEVGGSSKNDPATGIFSSQTAEPPLPHEYYRQFDPERFQRMMSALNVHVRIDGKELPPHGHDDDQDDPGPPPHEHDDPDDDLDSPPDNPPDKNTPGIKSPQLNAGFPPDSPLDGQTVPDSSGRSPDDPGHPDNWPQAGADVSERNRAYTQGSGDGKVTRGAPAAPFSPDDGDSGGGGDQGEDPNEPGSDDEDTPFSKDGALAMFTAAASSPSFRWEFTAAWNDVVAKAKRIRAEGHVRIVHASPGMVVGEVRGDHDTYESGIQRPVGKRTAIQHWACGCPWASFHQDKAAATRYAGRPCSHVMALQFEAQARGMFGRVLDSDPGVPQWAPPTVVVKSLPPYEGDPHAGRWSEEWRAPLARQRAYRASARRHAPAERATAGLLRAGEDHGTVGALRLLAGMRATADQANGPWGSNNVTQHPPQKPYGATSEPNKDQDPGSYGFLAAPDPENWGSIQEDSAYQMPLGNTAAHQVLVPGAPHPQPGDLHWPDMSGWQAEDQGTFGYTDRSGTAGPSTAMNPGDPQGIRMEESLLGREPGDEEATHGQLAAHIHGEHPRFFQGDLLQPESLDADDLRDLHWTAHQLEREQGQEDEFRYVPHDTPIDPVLGALAAGTPFPYHGTVPQLDGALAELRDHPEPALPETTAEEPGPGTLRASGAADGTIGGTDAGTGQGQGAPPDEAALGEFGASVRAGLRRMLGGTPMGDLARETFPQAQQPSPVGQEPGSGSGDDHLSPDDASIQAMGNQQWSGGGADSDEGDVPAGQPQGEISDIVASFQRSAASKTYSGGAGPRADGDIAEAARRHLAKALPKAEADELIREGAGSRARNLDLLRLEGTHYEDEDEELARGGLPADDYEDDVMFA